MKRRLLLNLLIATGLAPVTCFAPVRAQQIPARQQPAAQAPASPGQTAQERAQAMTALAVDEFNRGRMEAAEAKLRASLSVAENIYETHFWLGRVYAARAGSSPQAKVGAIAEFRRALELQPYGEDGELARGWLLRIGGRPKRILFVPAEHAQSGQTDGDASQRVVEDLQALARQSGFETEDTPREAINLGHSNSRDLAKQCDDEAGRPQAGWMVCVSVEKLTVEQGEKSGYHASGNARMWIFDPLARHLYPPVAVGGSSTNLLALILGVRDDNWDAAYKSGVSDVSQSIWDKCRRIIALNIDPVVLDETTFPLRLEGVYARAAVPYHAALQLPLVGFTACATPGATDADDADAAKVLTVQVQQALLKSGKVTVISPGNVAEALAALGHPENSTNPVHLNQVGQSSGSRYIVLWSLTQFNVRSKSLLVVTRVTAQTSLDLKVLDTQTGQVVHAKTYKQTAKVDKFLSGQAVKTLIAKQAETLSKVGDAAARDLLLFLAQHSTTPKNPEPPRAVVESPPVNITPTTSVPARPAPELETRPNSAAQEISLGAALVTVEQNNVRVVLAPVAAFARWAGARASAQGNTMTVQRGAHIVMFRADSPRAQRNGKPFTMSAPATVRDGVFYAPLSQLIQGLGARSAFQDDSVVRLTFDDGKEGLLRLPQ